MTDADGNIIAREESPKDKDAFDGIVEVTEPAAGELDLFKAQNGGETKNEFRIVR